MKGIQKERAENSSSRPLKVNHEVNPYDTTESVKVSIGIQIEVPKPRCGLCGCPMNLLPFRVSGKNGPRYQLSWVCDNHDGEGNCPSYQLDGKQVIDIPKAGEGTA